MKQPGSIFLRAVGLSALCVSPSLAQTTVYHLGGSATGDEFGSSSARLGDIDGDGFDDFIVGAPNASALVPLGGVALVYSGQSGALIHEIQGNAPFGFLGCAVGPAGDYDGDGYPEFLVGARGDDKKGSNAGAVRVYSGKTGTLFVLALGDSAGDAFGSSIGVLGDADGDGVDDIVVGMPGSDALVIDGGGFRVFSGRTATVIFDYYGDVLGERLGSAVSSVGDIDGDGLDDILASSSQSSVGVVHAISSGTQQRYLELRGDPSGDGFGSSLALIGDVNGDGRDDLAVGAPLANTSVPGGAVFLFSGLDGSEFRFVAGDTAGDMFGKSVAPAGDVDGDGHADFAVGIPYRDRVDGVTLTDAGEVRVYSGAKGSVLFKVSGQSSGGLYGWSLTNIGDANRDGVIDLVAGAVLDDRGVTQAGTAEVIAMRMLSLSVDAHLISLSAGGTQTMTIDLDPSMAGQLYWIVGGHSGTYPGVPTSAGHLFLNPDDYSTLTIATPKAGVVSPPIGGLDVNGDAFPRIDIPAGTDPAFVGATLYHAAAIYDSTTFELELVTNTVPITAVQ